jgi:penicillin-binding protein 1B
MARRRKNPPARKRQKKRSTALWLWLAGLAVVLVAALAVYVVYLDAEVRSQFEGRRWALPAQVYARPLELYAEQAMSAEQFASELRKLNYRETAHPKEPGTYARQDGVFAMVTRSFRFWDDEEPSRFLRLEFSGGRLLGIWAADDGAAVDLLRLDPPLIGRIYPRHNEDRVLVKLAEVPPLLIDALLAVEDHGFYEHHGIAPLAVLRALWVNLRAGQTVQGGSTLTQQLVKNFFLSSERTITRKFNEAIMSLLVEHHYGKDEILEAYLNEIYLGQDGQRAIHGFGLASQFYFERPLSGLRPEQIALLVALVKGPSYYDPRRFPQRALERRDLVLQVMREQQLLPPLKIGGLGVTPLAQSGVTNVPAFMDLVRRQLQRDYSDEDLRSEGLRIFTTLDPSVQRDTERALTKQLQRLDNSDDTLLQGAAVVVNVDDGEVLAVAGGRDPRFAGFNRALDAQRPIGSLIKPAVYLTALARGDYSLTTLLDDGPLTLEQENGEVWQPENFDHENHGQVPLFQALAQSYNLSTARLGMELGVPAVIDTLHALGVKQEIEAYPALLLGAVNLSPLTVAQMYHTLAAGGFQTPLRAIRAVLTADGRPLQRYPLSVEQTVAATPVFLVNAALEDAARHGTGSGVYAQLPQDRVVAGKTGSSDDLRDSWFAGFSADRLAAVWVGRDDNQSVELTGAGGALHVWSEIMSAEDVRSRDAVAPQEMDWVWVDTLTGLRVDDDCANARYLPFINGAAPTEWAKCEEEHR